MADEALGLMCMHAHPDDESITTGGVLSRYADEGMRTAVVTCTGGELGEIFGPQMDPEQVRPRLGQVRRDELTAALGVLGAGAPRLLGFRDSGMLGAEGNNDPDSFWRAPFDEAVRRMVLQIREFRPQVLVTYDAFGGYGHPDHVQTHRVGIVAAEAAAVGALFPGAGPPWSVSKLYLSTIPRSAIMRVNQVLSERGLPSPFPQAERISDLKIGTPDKAITTEVDVGPWLARKLQALRCHVSQLAEESIFLNLATAPDLEAAFFGQEWFMRQRSAVHTPHREDDLFAGLR
ncbi:MAG TPA: N-acetyl-1-D-myo-inositol-2-amino-2-deoxy-alpha-D-glucopyranoside deacetylase [Egibacteraceae bacterium]|nr:N-acetyl-1-D-myo-inositol-2-amino-2-deoxy-alpha-D-glucopyranoside deacetylase [Egibacteraceae bacterium]